MRVPIPITVRTDRPDPAGRGAAEPLSIDCDQCSEQGSSACDDCVVTFLCDRPEGAVVIDAAEVRALRLLGQAGLAPRLRHQRRTG